MYFIDDDISVIIKEVMSFQDITRVRKQLVAILIALLVGLLLGFLL